MSTMPSTSWPRIAVTIPAMTSTTARIHSNVGTSVHFPGPGSCNGERMPTMSHQTGEIAGLLTTHRE